jgi:hypothetical protein
VGPRAANKWQKLAIELTIDLLVVDLETRSTPVVSGEEAVAERPPWLRFRCARRQRVVACVSGGCASVWRGTRGGWAAPEVSGGWSSALAAAMAPTELREVVVVRARTMEEA